MLLQTHKSCVFSKHTFKIKIIGKTLQWGSLVNMN